MINHSRLVYLKDAALKGIGALAECSGFFELKIFGGQGSMFDLRNAFKHLLISLLPNLGSKQECDPANPRIIVLVNLENLGDFALFTSVIREVKLNFPSSSLIVVAQRENRELANFCPYVEKWIWIRGHKKPKQGMGHGIQTGYSEKLIKTYLALLFFGRRKIDLLLGPDWLLVNNTEQFTSNILFQKANPKADELTLIARSNRQSFKDESHQVTRTLTILKMFGLRIKSDEIENWITKEDRIALKHCEEKAFPKILVSLGAGQARRNWPSDRVVQLIKLLQNSFPGLIVTVIGPKSMKSSEIDRALLELRYVRNLVGKTDLSSVVSLMQDADLLISNDSGLVHIGASLKLPTVVVSAHPLNGDPWHLHSPKRYHPWKTNHRVVQPQILIEDCVNSCENEAPHCIATIAPEEVLEACRSLLTGKTS
jgi:ADP-heptose:LPS heptosyltransferase